MGASCAETDLVDIAEAQSPHHADDFLVFAFLKLCRKAGSNNGGNRAACVQQPGHILRPVQDTLCSLAADPGTIAATNAALGNHMSLAIRNPDGFCRAFPNTRVTDPATLFYSLYKTYALHGCSARF
jgi:hypothetical protein